jgi:hypothetical protein
LQARYAAVAEGITGQFYLPILVARLVGMQMSRAGTPSTSAARTIAGPRTRIDNRLCRAPSRNMYRFFEDVDSRESSPNALTYYIR